MKNLLSCLAVLLSAHYFLAKMSRHSDEKLLKIKLLKNIIITLVFLSVHALFAGNDDPIQEQNNLLIPAQELLNDHFENGDQLEGNLEDDFNCFLMMDPGMLESIAKGAEEKEKTFAEKLKDNRERDKKAQEEKAKAKAQRPVVIPRNVLPSQNQVTATYKLPEITTGAIPTSAISSTSVSTNQLKSIGYSSPEVKKSHETGVIPHKVSSAVSNKKPVAITLADPSERKLLNDEDESEGTLGFLKEEIRHNILSIIFAELATQTGHEAEASEKVAKEIAMLKKKLGYQPEWDSARLEDTLVDRRKIGKMALSRAQESKGEADWINAYEEANELDILLQQIIHKTNEKIILAVQQEEKEKYNKEYQELQQERKQWLEKATLAETKGNCAKLRDCWERFFQTVEDYEKNPDLSARSIIEGAGEISSITHEIASMIKKSSREVGDTMSYANNALRSLIDAEKINPHDRALLAKKCAERVDALWSEEAQTMVHIGSRIIHSAKIIRQAAQSVDGKIKTTQNSSNERQLLMRDKMRLRERQRAVKQKEGKLKTLETLLEQEKKILESNYQKKEEKVALEYSQRLQELEEQEKVLALQQEELKKSLEDNENINSKRKELETQEKKLQEEQKALEETKSAYSTYFVKEKEILEQELMKFEILSEKLKEDLDKLNNQESLFNKEKEWLKAREASVEARENELSEIFKQKAAQAEEKARVSYEAALQQMTTETKGMVNEAQEQIREAEAAKREAEQIAQEALRKMKADQEKNKNLVDQAQEETERLREALRALEEKNRIAECDKIEAEKRVLEIKNATEEQMAQLKAKAQEAETNQVKAELGKAAIEITMILKDPQAIAILAQDSYKKALKVSMDEMALFWDQAIMKAQEAETSYGQAEKILLSRSENPVISLEVKELLDQNLEEVQKVHAFWVNQVVEWNQEKTRNKTIKNETSPLIQNAEQEEIQANDDLRQAKELSLNISQETQEAAWSDALDSAKKTAQAWGKVVTYFKAHEKDSIMSYWAILMNQAENQVIRWNTKSLWRKANQLEVKVFEAVTRAERLRKGSEENIQTWGEVLEPAKRLEGIMKQVESIYEENVPKVFKELKEFKKELVTERDEAGSYYKKCSGNIKNILEKKRESIFFKDAGGPIIEDAKASLIKAQQLEKQADIAYQKAQSTVGEGIGLVWDDALTQIEKAGKAYEQSIKIYENDKNKIANASNVSKIVWNKEFEIVKAGKIACATKLEASKIEKTKKTNVLLEELLKAKQEQIANLHIEITRLINEPTRKAVIAQEAYEKATKALGTVALWEEAITKAQETAAIYSQTEQVLLRGSEQVSSKQFKALWEQNLEIIKNHHALWTNKAVTWTQEKDQSIDCKKMEEKKELKKKAAQDLIIKWKKQAEDALQKSAKAQTAGKMYESEGWNNVRISLLSAIEQKGKTVEAEVNNEESTIAPILKEAVQQSIQASNYYIKAINAYIEGEKTHAEFFNNAANDTKSSADYLELAAEIFEKNSSQEKDSLYQKLAEQYQLAAKYKQETAEQLIHHHRDAANAFNNNISDAQSRIGCLKKTLDFFEKAVNAEKMGNQGIASFYHKLIEQHKFLDNLYKSLQDSCQRVRRRSTNNGRDSYYLAADTRFLDYTRECANISNNQMALAVKTLEKAREAEKNGNQEIAPLYNKQIEKYQHSAEYYRKAGELHISKNATEANYFQEAGNFSKKITELIELVISATKYAQEAKESGNRDLASLYHKQVDVYQHAVKYYQRAEELLVSRNKTEAMCFHTAGCLEERNVETLELAIKILKKAQEEEKNGNQEIGSLYHKQVNVYQHAAEYYQKEAIATTIGNKIEVNCLQEARNFTQLSIEMLTTAIKTLEKAQEIERNGNKEVSSLYRKQVKVYQSAVEYYQKKAVAIAEGNTTIAKYSEEAINFTQPSVDMLTAAIKTLDKAQEIEENGNQDVSSLYHKQVKVYQSAAEYYQEAAVRSVEGNEIASNYIKEAVSFTKSTIKVLELAIEALKKAQEAEENGNQDVSSLYHKQVEVYQNAAEYYQKEAVAIAKGNKTAAKYSEEAINFTQPSVDMLTAAIKTLEKAQEMERNGNQDVGSLYHKQVKVYQSAAEYYQEAAVRSVEGNEIASNYIKEAVSFT
ncbi:MAG TPA: hypothetical protein VJK54_07020, partial [Chthoniobacterales bacterium]|nr:hypothetical protein [Chthoniobacterales bacterium]